MAGAAGSGPMVRRSPRERVTLVLSSATLSIEYGRPAVAGREVWGILVPWGELFRAGDDEASVFATDTPLRLGSLAVPAGRYSLFLRPDPVRPLLILNRQPDQWGAFNHDPALDLGSVALTITSTSIPIERFAIVLEPADERSGRLWIGWQRTVWMVALELAEATAPSPPGSP
jgi:Protein of unknown function (DUF2911)